MSCVHNVSACAFWCSKEGRAFCNMLPPLGRLSLGASATIGAPAAKAARVAEDAAPPAGLADLPPELVEELIKRVDAEDPCYEVAKLCEVRREWRAWCKSGAIYDAANRALGYYGRFKTWGAVLAHYAAWGKVPPGGGGRAAPTPRDYFQRACQTIFDLDLENVPVHHPFYEARLLMQMRATGLIPLQNVPTRLSNYGAIARIALEWDGDALRYVHPDRADYGELARVALARVGQALRYVSPHRPDYGELAMIALLQDGTALRHVPRRSQLAFALIAVQQNGMALNDYQADDDDDGPETEEYFEVCKAAVRQNGLALQFVMYVDGQSEFFVFGEVARIAVEQDPNALIYVPPDWVADYGELARIAVRKQWDALTHVDIGFAGYGEIAREVLQGAGIALDRVPTTRVDFGELAMVAVLADGEALQYVPGDRDDYFEIARAAVQRVQRGRDALRFVDNEREDFGALASVALQRHGQSLEHVPVDRDDFGALATIALLQDGEALQHVPTDRGDYVALAKIAMQRTPAALEHLLEHLSGFSGNVSDEDYIAICEVALRQDPDALEFVTPLPIRRGYDLSDWVEAQPRHARQYFRLAKFAVQKKATAFQQMQWDVESYVEQLGLARYLELATIAVRGSDSMLQHVPEKYREAVRAQARAAILASRQ